MIHLPRGALSDKVTESGHHQILYSLGHQISFGSKPRVPFGKERTWFYEFTAFPTRR